MCATRLIIGKRTFFNFFAFSVLAEQSIGLKTRRKTGIRIVPGRNNPSDTDAMGILSKEDLQLIRAALKTLVTEPQDRKKK